MEEIKTTAKERVEIELNDLKEKITKLNTFRFSVNFSNISDLQQELLKEQVYYMEKYADILIKRLVHWEDK